LDAVANDNPPLNKYLVLLAAGTYDRSPDGFEIIPNNPDTFDLTMRPMPGAEDQVFLKREDLTPGLVENEAAIEIFNSPETSKPTCLNMRVTIEGLDIWTRGRPGGISVWSSREDPLRLYNTGLFIRGNTVTNVNGDYSPDGYPTKLGKGLVIGTRPEEGYYAQQLVHQSIKWGEITDNEIDASADGATCWVFSGLIANNRVRSRIDEGWHHSFGRIHEDLDPPSFIPSVYWNITVEHNLFYCSWKNGFHFAHGSAGVVSNNIFTGSRADDLTEDPLIKLGGIGLDIGIAQGLTTAGVECREPGECVSDAELSAAAGTQIFTNLKRLVNNTFDMHNGPGILTNDATVKVGVYKGNLLTRCDRDDPDSGPDGNQAIDFSVQPPDPAKFGYSSESDPVGFNVYWDNQGGHYGDAVYQNVAKDRTEDWDSTPPYDGSRPWYRGRRTPMKYSYMLWTEEIVAPCDNFEQSPKDRHSRAADSGPDDVVYKDATGGPGVWSSRNDAGAFGGPNNWWDPTGGEECLEYAEYVVQCTN